MKYLCALGSEGGIAHLKFEGLSHGYFNNLWYINLCQFGTSDKFCYNYAPMTRLLEERQGAKLYVQKISKVVWLSAWIVMTFLMRLLGFFCTIGNLDVRSF